MERFHSSKNVRTAALPHHRHMKSIRCHCLSTLMPKFAVLPGMLLTVLTMSARQSRELNFFFCIILFDVKKNSEQGLFCEEPKVRCCY